MIIHIVKKKYIHIIILSKKGKGSYFQKISFYYHSITLDNTKKLNHLKIWSLKTSILINLLLKET